MPHDLPDSPEALKALIGQLWEKLERLEAENAELRRRLGRDSTNSDRPPSSDGYRKRPVRPGLPKAGKRRGGQPGHRGRTLERVAHPDHRVVHLPQRCCGCGRVFSAHEAAEVMATRQVFDLPSPRLEVTEHGIGRIACCGLEQCGVYPPDVSASVQYGAGVRALVTQLSVDHKLPLEQIGRLFEDLYGYALNSTTIEAALGLGHALAESIEAQVRARLHVQEAVHFDETGLRVAGRLQWLHTAASEWHTHLFVHEKRGTEALESAASVLKDYTGTAVHDCWRAYFRFDAARHVLCGAHVLRELNALAEEGAVWARELHAWLLELHAQARPVADAEAVRTRYRALLAEADREEPPPRPGKRGRPKRSVGRNLLERLRKHEDGVLAFALEPDVPFTNNQAERDLRAAKVKLKVSGCFRTPSGAQIYARLQAAISTFRKQGLKVFATLRDLFSLRPIVVL